MASNNREELLKKARAKKELARRKARNNFWAFCLFVNFEFFSKRPILKLVADAFQRVMEKYESGLIWKIAVSMPPRFGKSYITCVFSAWMLGRNPKQSVMRNTCSAPLYQKLSYDTRDIIKSDKYREVFPEIRLQPDKQNVNGWSLTESIQVGYFGAGVGGTIIGFGASMLAITDDLFKGFEEAMSETVNEKTWMWKDGTHDSRYEQNCCSVDIGTRWCKKDVLGRLMDQDYYDEVILIPALDENGKTTCEAVHTTEYYQEKEKTSDDMIWSAEYMQQPIEAKGLLFPKSELNLFTLKELEGKEPDGVIGACDVADKGTDDFSAPFSKIFSDRFFITDVVFTKDPVEITEPRLSQMILDTKCDRIRIESNNGGRIFSNNIKKALKDNSSCDIQARQTTKNKETRIIMKSGFIKAHFWFRSDYEKGSDYDRFMQGLTSYMRLGGNKHDDAPDSVTILAEFIEHIGLDKIKVNIKPKPTSKSSYGIF